MMTRLFLKSFLVLLATILPSTALDASTCAEAELVCHPGSTCSPGDTDYSSLSITRDINDVPFEFLTEPNKNGWHCDCPSGLTGLRCNRPVEECGNGHLCFHGGKCIDGLADVVTGDKLFCDCSDAFHFETPMVGKYCEIDGAIQCGDSQIFCTNRGSCMADFETMAHPCDCRQGHRGPHCEFDTGFVPECTLPCENGGTCMLGIKDYDTALQSEFWANHDGNFQYCSCPQGWFGYKCEVRGEICGDKTCFNGATCLETERSNNSVEYTCDCSTANNDQKSFSGEFCENEATAFCSKTPDQNGQLFCTNGGVCKEPLHEGCECPEGFHGPVCEFRDQQTVDTCRLQCKNGGRCRSGKKDNELFKQFGDELKKFNETHQLWEHCVCPEGYFGIQCEHQLEVCPGGEHVCLHGSECVPNIGLNAVNTHSCDCDGANNGNEKYAGKFCQYSSTDICTTNGRPGVGKANFAFCVNEGKCKSKVTENDPHPGCTCPNGFTGDHCEFLVSTSASSTRQENKSNDANKGLVVGLAITMLLLVVLVSFALLRKYFVRNQVERDTGKEQPSTPTTMANSPVRSGEEVEEIVDMQASSPSKNHEETLQTVEII